MIVGFAQGDVNGIGYELLIKMMAENKICELCTPVLFGSSKAAAYHRKSLNVENFALNSIQAPQDANAKRCNVINCVDDSIKVDLGQQTAESDAASMIALNAALEALERGEVNVVVGAPQSNASFKPASGCIDFFATRYDVRNAMPLLVGEKMRIGFVTHQLPLREVAEQVTFNSVLNKLKLLDTCLKQDFMIRKPRIAVLGLNPHNGENCLYGEEEKSVIAPAIEKARSNGIMALGPYAPDALFSGVDFSKFDAILAMYHDQGMVPFKAIEGNDGAMLVAGLPVVFTSPVHGMAFDIVGKGIADEFGMRNALYLAMDVYHHRRMNADLSGNPLTHYNMASNNNEADLNVEQIAGIKSEE